jgi:uncharacterized repeat protein (TIGR03803 family)
MAMACRGFDPDPQNRHRRNPKMQTTNKLSMALVLVLASFVRAPGAGATSGLVLQALHEFPSTPRMPYYGLIQARDGNLYGPALETGPDNPGTIYKLTPGGVLSTLYSFPARNESYAGARGPLLQASDGNFYGTALGLVKTNDGGMVFKLTTNGLLTPLYSFRTGASGVNPSGPLIQGGDGNLYGTASFGGAHSCGTIFKVTTTGDCTTLASFDGTNGTAPFAGVIRGRTEWIIQKASGLSGVMKPTRICRTTRESTSVYRDSPPPIAPRLAVAMMAGGQAGISFVSEPGRNFMLEVSDSLAPAQWTTGASLLGDGSPATLLDTNGPSPRRFYRIRVE